MEGYRAHFPESTPATPEITHGTGTLESNDSGKTETRAQEERRDQFRKLLRLAMVLEILKTRVKSTEMRNIALAVIYHSNRKP